MSKDNSKEVMTVKAESVYELDKVIKIKGYKIYLLEHGSEHFAGLPSYNMEIDLGMRRILKLKCLEAYLMIVGAGEIRKIKLDSPVTNIRSLLLAEGYKPVLRRDYRKYQDAWKHAIGYDSFNYGISGFFTEHGYAVQKKIWADCCEHTVEAGIVTPGWLRIDGHKIIGAKADLVLSDVLELFGDKLIRVLEEPADISGYQFVQCLKDAGLEDVIPHIRLIEE